MNAIAGFRHNEVRHIPHIRLFPAYQHLYSFVCNETVFNREEIIDLI